MATVRYTAFLSALVCIACFLPPALASQETPDPPYEHLGDVSLKDDSDPAGWKNRVMGIDVSDHYLVIYKSHSFKVYSLPGLKISGEYHLNGTNWKIDEVSISPKGSYMAIRMGHQYWNRNKIIIVDSALKTIKVFRAKQISQLSFSKDEHYFAFVAGKKVRIIKTQKWNKVAQIEGEPDKVLFDENSTMLATFRADKTGIDVTTLNLSTMETVLSRASIDFAEDLLVCEDLVCLKKSKMIEKCPQSEPEKKKAQDMGCKPFEGISVWLKSAGASSGADFVLVLERVAGGACCDFCGTYIPRYPQQYLVSIHAGSQSYSWKKVEGAQKCGFKTSSINGQTVMLQYCQGRNWVKLIDLNKDKPGEVTLYLQLKHGVARSEISSDGKYLVAEDFDTLSVYRKK